MHQVVPFAARDGPLQATPTQLAPSPTPLPLPPLLPQDSSNTPEGPTQETHYQNKSGRLRMFITNTSYVLGTAFVGLGLYPFLRRSPIPYIGQPLPLLSKDEATLNAADV